jgi:fatty-acyl-CoA synthase
VFDGLTAPRSIAGERCSALHVVPTIFIGELERQRVNEFDLSTPFHADLF